MTCFRLLQLCVACVLSESDLFQCLSQHKRIEAGLVPRRWLVSRPRSTDTRAQRLASSPESRAMLTLLSLPIILFYFVLLDEASLRSSNTVVDVGFQRLALAFQHLRAWTLQPCFLRRGPSTLESIVVGRFLPWLAAAKPRVGRSLRTWIGFREDAIEQQVGV